MVIAYKPDQAKNHNYPQIIKLVNTIKPSETYSLLSNDKKKKTVLGKKQQHKSTIKEPLWSL